MRVMSFQRSNVLMYFRISFSNVFPVPSRVFPVGDDILTGRLSIFMIS